MKEHNLLERLNQIVPVRKDEPMSRHTSFRIGGPAEIYVVAREGAQLEEILRLAQESGMPFFLLGAGSNLLVSDQGIRGLVIENRLQGVNLIESPSSSAIVKAESGTPLAKLARRMSMAGWKGLEWAIGIPGSVGGAIVYNAGAFGGCIADVARSVRIVNGSSVREIGIEHLGLGYRQSDLTKGDKGLEKAVIISAEFALHRSSPEILMSCLSKYTAQRRMSQPSQPSAGSVFKNPEGHAAGQLIEQVGLKGYRIGDACISNKHANFIVNLGQARATDVDTLMRLAQEKIYQSFGIKLELEIERVGEGF